MGVCAIRGADFGDEMIQGFCSSAGTNGMSTLGMYSSDVGKLIVRSSDANQYLLAIGTTVARSTTLSSTGGRLVGYLASVQTSPTGVGTTGSKIYINRFSGSKEYEITYSTVYSATIPADTDIGKGVNTGGTTTIAGAVISLASITSSGVGAGTTKIGAFQITGYDNNRRKVYVRPILASGEFES